jgi:beta-aspartyl-peptidase (threonine type)
MRMHGIIPLALACWVGMATLALTPDEPQTDSPAIAMVIHGGAGTIRKENMTPEREAKYRATLTQALQTGHAVLAEGGSAVDAVEATIRVMEDSPLFNAGKGAVFTSEGRNELDSSIMEGATHNAGAVASVVRIKNPISAARKVMTESKHVMLVGEGAEVFAQAEGLELVDNEYFFTQERWDRLQKAIEEEKAKGAQHGSAGVPADKFGTVGCVALDKGGNIAAGTSTGGLTNKRWGRVGDSPIIGAGTYADNGTCGVSGTGVGELFMRGMIAYEVSVQMHYAKKTVEQAAQYTIHTKLTGMGGANTGGVIALDKNGKIAMEFNTTGMYRGYIREDGVAHTFLYKDDEGTE